MWDTERGWGFFALIKANLEWELWDIPCALVTLPLPASDIIYAYILFRVSPSHNL